MPARGGALKLLDAFIAIGGDASDFDRVVDQSEAKAKKAGDRIESAFSPRRVIGALATATGAVFGLMAKGGIELNETLTNVQARSGAVGAQWDAMSTAIQRQNRRTTLSLQEIGDGVAAIKTDLGATADEVGLASDRLTDFGLVANESFQAAVLGADDLRDAYQLTLAQTLSVLDALVASRQKYGGSLTDNRAALIALAPALTAANLGWQDGIELINLFNAAGVDAAAIPVALQRALTQVHSPYELKALIADISATEDPFLRAEKAAELFGARAGAKMAAALAPGRGALEDYAITADESAGSVDAAARKIDSSWRRTLDLIVQNVTGFLAEMGNTTGPVLAFAGSIGSAFAGLALMFPGLAPKLAGGLRTMFARILPTAVAGGSAMGTAAGLAFAAGFAAAAVVVVADVFDYASNTSGEKQAAADAVSSLGTASLEALMAARADIKTRLDSANQVWSPIEDFLGWSSKADLQKALDALDAEIARRPKPVADKAGTDAGAGLADAAAAALTAAAPRIEAAATTAFGGIPNAIAGLTASTRQAIADNLAAAANELTSQRTGIDALIDQLNENRKKRPLTQTTELERLLQARGSKALAEELRSPDHARRATAKALAAQLDSAIADLKPRPGIMSQVSKDLLADLETSAEPDLKAFAGWFQAEFSRQAVAAAAAAALAGVLAATPIELDERGAKTGRGAAKRREAMIAALVPSDASREAAAAIHGLLEDALGSADPLIKADARAEGRRFTQALADSIASDGSKTLLAQAFAELWGAGIPDVLTTPRGALSGGPTSSPTGPSRIYEGAASGMPYVDRDKLVYLHQREAVLTVDQAEDWRAGRNGGGPREQNITIEHVEIRDAHDEFSLTQQLQFLAQAG